MNTAAAAAVTNVVAETEEKVKPIGLAPEAGVKIDFKDVSQEIDLRVVIHSAHNHQEQSAKMASWGGSVHQALANKAIHYHKLHLADLSKLTAAQELDLKTGDTVKERLAEFPYANRDRALGAFLNECEKAEIWYKGLTAAKTMPAAWRQAKSDINVCWEAGGLIGEGELITTSAMRKWSKAKKDADEQARIQAAMALDAVEKQAEEKAKKEQHEASMAEAVPMSEFHPAVALLRKDADLNDVEQDLLDILDKYMAAKEQGANVSNLAAAVAKCKNAVNNVVPQLLAGQKKQQSQQPAYC